MGPILWNRALLYQNSRLSLVYLAPAVGDGGGVAGTHGLRDGGHRRVVSDAGIK